MLLVTFHLSLVTSKSPGEVSSPRKPNGQSFNLSLVSRSYTGHFSSFPCKYGRKALTVASFDFSLVKLSPSLGNGSRGQELWPRELW